MWRYGSVATFLILLCIVGCLVAKADILGDNVNNTKSRPRLVVHIGPHKTGSTSFQAFLVLHVNIFRSDNFENPFSLGTKDAANLAWALSNSSSLDRTINRERIEHNWIKTLALAHQKGTNLIVSSEVFGSFSAVNWSKFARLTRQFDVHIVMVYRDAASWLSSWYQENMWQTNGEEELGFIDYINDADNQYIDNVNEIAFLVKGQFGRDHVHIVDYNGMLAVGSNFAQTVFCEMFPTWFPVTCLFLRKDHSINVNISNISNSSGVGGSSSAGGGGGGGGLRRNTRRSELLEKALHLAVKNNHTSMSNYHSLLLQLGDHLEDLPTFPRACLTEFQLRRLFQFAMDIDRKFRLEWGRSTLLLHNNVTATVQLLACEFRLPINTGVIVNADSVVSTASVGSSSDSEVRASGSSSFDESLLSDKWCDLDSVAFQHNETMLKWMASLTNQSMISRN